MSRRKKRWLLLAVPLVIGFFGLSWLERPEIDDRLTGTWIEIKTRSPPQVVDFYSDGTGRSWNLRSPSQVQPFSWQVSKGKLLQSHLVNQSLRHVPRPLLLAYGRLIGSKTYSISESTIRFYKPDELTMTSEGWAGSARGMFWTSFRRVLDLDIETREWKAREDRDLAERKQKAEERVRAREH